MRDFCYTVILIALIIGGCTLFGCMIDSIRCNETGKTLGYKTEWHYWTGCVVQKPSGERVLLRQMRAWEGEK